MSAQLKPLRSFSERVVELTKQIPVGHVTTYGYLAALAGGSPRSAIAVGQILHRHAERLELPWQRVINSQGIISTTCLEHGAELQARLLSSEGITVSQRDGLYRVDLQRYAWSGKVEA